MHDASAFLLCKKTCEINDPQEDAGIWRDREKTTRFFVKFFYY